MKGTVVAGLIALVTVVPASTAFATTVGNCQAPPEETIFEVHNTNAWTGETHVCVAP